MRSIAINKEQARRFTAIQIALAKKLKYVPRPGEILDSMLTEYEFIIKLEKENL